MTAKTVVTRIADAAVGFGGLGFVTGFLLLAPARVFGWSQIRLAGIILTYLQAAQIGALGFGIFLLGVLLLTATEHNRLNRSFWVNFAVCVLNGTLAAWKLGDVLTSGLGLNLGTAFALIFLGALLQTVNEAQPPTK